MDVQPIGVISEERLKIDIAMYIEPKLFIQNS